MNPHNNQSPDYDHTSLPVPMSPADQSQARSSFPPLGTSLPAYLPGSYAPDAGNEPTTRLNGQTAPPRVKQPWAWKRWLKRSLIILLVVGLLGGGYVGTKLLINASKSLHGGVLGLFQTQKLHGESVGRVNILLAGNSADDAGHDGADLTDSIMIISIDTVSKRAFLLSVPRDLWVKLPNKGYNKINAAYVFGKADKFSESGLPSGGMGELENIIDTNFGITINYYGLVNYATMRDAVNAVGGIDVTIASTDPRGLYDPSIDYSVPGRRPLVRLTNGLHHLNGQQALNLARARGDAYGSYGFGLSDFTRTANQRLMLTAIKQKAVTAGVISNPVTLGNLLDSFGNNVQTDFQTSEVRRLVSLVKDIPSANITSASLNDANGTNLLKNYQTYNGQSALIPAAGVNNYSGIVAYLNKLMTPPASTSPKTTSSSSTQ